MAGRGTRATSADFNNIQTIVSSVLGVGSGTQGYGQTVTSAPVTAGSAITVAQWTNLRNDLSKCRVHQTNSAIINGLASIAANRGSPWQTLQTVTSTTVISEDIRDQYAQFASGGVNGNRDSIAASGQSTSGVSITTATRTTNWGSGGDVSISHTVTLTFAGYTPAGGAAISGENHMRCFFNAGGTIDFTASRSAGSGTSKDTSWTNMLALFGTFKFGVAGCSVTGSLNTGGSVNSSQGWRALTAGGAAVTYLTQASAAGVYAENRFTIQAQRPAATNQLQFIVTYRDADVGDQQGGVLPGPAVDEAVTGTLTTTITCTRPTGSNVEVPAPTGSSTAL